MTLDGIDVSAWQAASTDDRNMDGCAFVGIRACYGTSPDTTYAAHEANARKHGAVVLAYCFGRNGDGARQADALLAAAPHADLYVLDMERDGASPSMTASQASAFLARMAATTPKRTGLYHSESGFPSGLGERFRWVAKWGTAPPSGPWAFWQWQGSPLDRDRFNGTLAELRAMAGIAPAPAAPLYRVVIAGSSHGKVTDVFAAPSGAKVGELYRATVTAERHKVSGVWWYRITVAHGDAAKHVGRWFAAHSWMAATPVVPTPPKPALPPIPLTATDVSPVQSPPVYVAPRALTLAGLNAVEIGTSGPAFLLIHGGPQPYGPNREHDLDELGKHIATGGGHALAIDYHADTWQQAVSEITAAAEAVRALTGQAPVIVAFSFGGYPASLAFLSGAGRAYAAVDAVSSRAGLSALAGWDDAPDPIALAANRPTAPVAVIRGAQDPVDLPDDDQGFIAALHAAGHPGINVTMTGGHDLPLYADSTVTALMALAGMTA